ncbi:MAG TPA: hypothetical protein VM580_35425 [Labilithrix sp.]|nr:hypothetical protein [Labilithrix sp.]
MRPNAVPAKGSFHETIRAKLYAEIGPGITKEHIFWAVVDATAAIVDCAVPGAGARAAMFSLNRTYEYIAQGSSAQATVPNPWFVWNGHDDGPTTYTESYLAQRRTRNLGGAAASGFGAAASLVTQVSIGGMFRHGNALGSTGTHILKLVEMTKAHRNTATVRGWLDLIILMKRIKSWGRGAALLSSSIPTPMVSAVASLVHAAAGIGATLTMTNVSLATAAELHWRAYQELFVTQAMQRAKGFGDGTGPALRITNELFRRRGLTRVFGQYNVLQIVREPTGWLAIADKITLI